MKKYTLSATLFVLALALSFCSLAQTRTLPDIRLQALDGSTVHFADTMTSNNGKPVIISFWATWCKPCIRELKNINDLYEDWQEETGVKLVAVSIDDARNMARVAPFVNAQGWEYDVFLDSNGDFRRAMNVNNVPHTFLLDGKGNIVWQHNSYTEGDEYELQEVIEKVAAGEDINAH